MLAAVGAAVFCVVAFFVYSSLTSGDATADADSKESSNQLAVEEPAEPDVLSTAPAATGSEPAETPAGPTVTETIPIDNEPASIDWDVRNDPFSGGMPPGLNTGHLRPIQPGFSPWHFAASPDLKVAAVADANEIVEVWNLGSKKRQAVCRVPGEKIFAVALPEADTLVVWSAISGLQTFSTASGERNDQLEIPTRLEHGANVSAGLAVSPGGSYLALVRKGIRLYHTTDWKLSAILPEESPWSTLAVGFHPKGEKLIALEQTAAVPLRYRLMIRELKDGEPAEIVPPPRPGNLARADVSGPLYARAGAQNRLFLFWGGRAIVGEEGGRVVWLNARPHRLSVPLDFGSFWVAEADKPPEIAQMEWDQLEKAVKKFDFDRGSGQVSPDNGAAVRINVEATVGNQRDTVVGDLEVLLTERLRTQGFDVSVSGRATLIINYREKDGGPLTSLPYYDEQGERRAKPVSGSAKKTSPVVEIQWFAGDVKKKLWWRKFPVSSRDIVCTAEQAKLPPQEAYAQAALDAVKAELSGRILPYFMYKGLIGGSMELPLMTSKLK